MEKAPSAMEKRAPSVMEKRALPVTEKRAAPTMEKQLPLMVLAGPPPIIEQSYLFTAKSIQSTIGLAHRTAQATEKAFSLLMIPAELRLMVFKYMFPPGSIVHVVDMVSFQTRFNYSLAQTRHGTLLSQKFTNFVSKRKKGSIFRAARCTISHMILGVSCRCHPHKTLDRLLEPAENINTRLAVLRTCRQIYHECLPLAYGNPIFSFIQPAGNMITSLALFFRTVKTASDHIQHVGFSLGEMSYDQGKILTEFKNWIFQPSRAIDGKLRSLYLRFDKGSDGTVFGSDSWRWTSALVKQNEKAKRIDRVYLRFEFKYFPKSDFLDRLERQIEGWSSAALKHRFIDRGIEGKDE